MQPLKSYNRMQMQLASSAAFPEPLLAAMPQLREKPRLGFSSKNPALHQVHEVCNSTTALGFRAALHLERIRSRYTGKERDAETGLDYFGARYYSGNQGRFTSPDEFKGGLADPFTGKDVETNTALPYADITDPQTLDKYAYVRNNPLRYIDPDGHETQQTLDPEHVKSVEKDIAAVQRFSEKHPILTEIFMAVVMTVVTRGEGEGAAPRGEPGEIPVPTPKVGSRTEPTLPPKTVVSEKGVEIRHYTKSGDHGPAHLHVEGEGPSTRIGQAGKPLKGDPPLSSRQAQVVMDNKATIRSATNKIMRWIGFRSEPKQGH